MHYTYAKFVAVQSDFSIIKETVYDRDITLQKLKELSIAIHSEYPGGIAAGYPYLLHLYCSFHCLFKSKDIIARNKLFKVYMKTDIFKIFRICKLEDLAVKQALGQLQGIIL